MSANTLFRADLSIAIARAVSFLTCLTNIRFHLLLSRSEAREPSAALCSPGPGWAANTGPQLIPQTRLCKTLRNVAVVSLPCETFLFPLLPPSTPSFTELQHPQDDSSPYLERLLRNHFCLQKSYWFFSAVSCVPMCLLSWDVFYHPIISRWNCTSQSLGFT